VFIIIIIIIIIIEKRRRYLLHAKPLVAWLKWTEKEKVW
jgi:hypothetical protein